MTTEYVDHSANFLASSPAPMIASINSSNNILIVKLDDCGLYVQPPFGLSQKPGMHSMQSTTSGPLHLCHRLDTQSKM